MKTFLGLMATVVLGVVSACDGVAVCATAGPASTAARASARTQR